MLWQLSAIEGIVQGSLLHIREVDTLAQNPSEDLVPARNLDVCLTCDLTKPCCLSVLDFLIDLDGFSGCLLIYANPSGIHLLVQEPYLQLLRWQPLAILLANFVVYRDLCLDVLLAIVVKLL